jgi:uncharacterized repeat protein (TIGR01451 family)
MMNIRFSLLVLLYTSGAWAAAPNDITTGQRVWFDGLDTSGQGYSSTVAIPSNPNNGALLSSWTSKINGYTANNTAGVSAPSYTVSSFGIGASYLGTGTPKALGVSGDIWGANGTTVPTVENITVATSNTPSNTGFLFMSYEASNGSNRIGSHFPWISNLYWDPVCCLANRSVPWTLVANQLYLTDWFASVALNNKQVIINATDTVLNNNTVGTYVQNPGSNYWLGSAGNFNAHSGIISENIVYNRLLNAAEKRILNNYASAKWGMSIGVEDRYAGDTAVNGLYRYHVAGIGQESSGSQTTATSEGLRIVNSSFLGNGRYIMVGLPGLSAAGTMSAYNQATSAILTAPQQLIGTVLTNIASNIAWRGNRVWYLDKTDATNSTGNVALIFDAAGAMGISAFTPNDYVGLLYRPNLTANFQTIATQPYTGSAPNFSISAASISTGYYTIGKVKAPVLSNQKTVTTINDPVNGSNNPKSIPGAVARYTITVNNQGEGQADDSTVIISDVVPTNTELFTGGLSSTPPFTFANGSPTSGLNCTFISLSSLTDCIDFSNDGGSTWVYAPNASLDYDPAVTHIRFKLTGVFNGAPVPATAPYPSFTLNFSTRIR